MTAKTSPKKAGKSTALAKQPPQPLVPHTKPSRRNPLGLPRCQRWAMRDGKFWQCPNAARQPMPVCPRHGAGFASREAKGLRENPALASTVVNASVKAPKAVAILLAQHPEFRALYEHHLSAPIAELLDFRPQIAAAKALVDAYVQKSRLEGDYGPYGSDSSIQRAIDAQEKLLRMAERYLSIEAKLGPMTQLELAWLRYAYVATMNAFLPVEKVEEAKAFCLRKLREARELGLGKEGVG